MRPIKFVKLAIVGAGVAVCLWFMFDRSRPYRRHDWTVLAAIAGAIASYMAADWYDQRQRRARLAEWMARTGFVLDPEATLDQGHYRPHHLHHSFALHLFGRADWKGRRARAVEYEFKTGAGRTERTHRRFEGAVECPAAWPAFELVHPKGLASRPISRLFSADEGAIGDGPFDRRWRMASDDDELALAVLTPGLRAWLAAAPGRETWCCGDGWLSCTWEKACDEGHAERVLARVATFLAKAGEASRAGAMA